jgi:hypothetical protein
LAFRVPVIGGKPKTVAVGGGTGSGEVKPDWLGLLRVPNVPCQAGFCLGGSGEVEAANLPIGRGKPKITRGEA